MGETRQLSFELERFEWAAADRLEVVGRWQGIGGRKLARPVLSVDAGGRRRRLTAMPGGQLTGGDEAWRATFAWSHGPEDIDGAELEIGRSLVVELPAPRTRKRRASSGAAQTEPVDRAVRAELAEMRAQIAELRESRSAAVARAEAAEAEVADAEVAAPEEAAADESPDPVETLRAQLAELRSEHDALRAEHDALGDRHAALISRSGELRGELDETIAENEQRSAQLHELEGQRDRLRAELEAREQELTGTRSELERLRGDFDQRIEAERDDAAARLEEARAGQMEVRESLATAREEAAKALAAEAGETDRVRAELAAAREEAEGVLAAERAETARMREELASRPAASDDTTEETDDASRRMYERISRELEHERATVRDLRRELDSAKAETAEKRRSTAAGATNGVHTATDETPVASTPVGRATSQRAAAVLAARARVEQQAPYRRVDAARAAAAGRVPEHEQSPTGVWIQRGAAIALLAVLLLAMVLIVSAIA